MVPIYDVVPFFMSTASIWDSRDGVQARFLVISPGQFPWQTTRLLQSMQAGQQRRMPNVEDPTLSPRKSAGRPENTVSTFG